MCHFHWKWGQLVLFCFCKSRLYSLFYTACCQSVILSLCSCSDSVFSAAVRRNLCSLCSPCPLLHSTWPSVSGNRCSTSPLPLPPADCTSITSRHCEKRAQKATPIEKRREEWSEKDQRDSRFSWSTSIRFFQLSNPCRQPAELDFYHFSSALLPHSDECQHTTSVPPSSLPSDRDDLWASSLSAPLRPPHRQLLHIPLSSSSAEKNIPCLPLQCKIRRHFQEEVRHIHLHSGQ